MVEPFSAAFTGYNLTVHLVFPALSRLVVPLLDRTFPKNRSKNDKVSEAEKKYWKAKGKREKQALELQQARLELQQAHLDWLREQQAVEIDLAMKKIQADYDKEHWAGILSRDEMVNILVNGQKQHRLLVIVSEPEVSSSCPRTFADNLPRQLRGELKKLLDDLYPPNNNLCPVEFYGKFFKTAVFDTQVKQLETVLSAIPTVVIYSEMTDEKLFLYLHSWGLPIPLSQVMIWDWNVAKERLQASRKYFGIFKSVSEKQSLREIQQEIVSTHQFLAAFLADIYYLSVNPFHEPRLFQLVRKDELLTKDLARCLENLRRLQDQRRTDYEEELRLLAEQERQKLEEIRQLEETFEEMQKQHNIVRDRLKQVAVEIDESLARFEKQYQALPTIERKAELISSVQADINNTWQNFEQSLFAEIGRKISAEVTFEKVSSEKSNHPSPGPLVGGIVGGVTPAIIGTNLNLSSEKSNFPIFALGSGVVAMTLLVALGMPNKLRKEAEAPALKIEAQLKQEEADLLQLLEEKRKAL